MLLIVTTYTAATLTLLYVGLGMRVINMRRTGRGPSFGAEGSEQFTRAVRVHANFSEYTPLFLILLGLYELQGGNTLTCSVCALIFISGRIMHLIGLGTCKKGPWRTLGMVCTNTTLIALAALLLSLVL